MINLFFFHSWIRTTRGRGRGRVGRSVCVCVKKNNIYQYNKVFFYFVVSHTCKLAFFFIILPFFFFFFSLDVNIYLRFFFLRHVAAVFII